MSHASYGIYAVLRSNAMAVTHPQQRSDLLRAGAGAGAEQECLKRRQ